MILNARSCTGSVLAILFSFLCASGASAAGVSIRSYGADELRLDTIAYRVGAASVHSCATPRMMSGLILQDLTQYDVAIRSRIASAFSLGDGIGILEVVPGSVADEAGLKIDDEILRVDGQSVEDPRAVASGPRSYDRLNEFSEHLEKALESGGADLLIRRRGQLIHTVLRGQLGCGGDAFVTSSSALNAWSDGSRIFVSSALMHFTQNDDELAFVVAHEMAHNILNHSSEHATHGLLGLFGFGALKIRREEKEADLFAVPLVRNGGFSPNGAIAILERLSASLWWDISLDHPGFGERIKIVSAAIAGGRSV